LKKETKDILKRIAKMSKKINIEVTAKIKAINDAKKKTTKSKLRFGDTNE
jgi:hypothetical protein